MGITNFVSRPFAGLATIVTEYTTQPLFYILIFAFSSLFVLDFIKEIDEEKVKPKKIKGEIIKIESDDFEKLWTLTYPIFKYKENEFDMIFN